MEKRKFELTKIISIVVPVVLFTVLFCVGTAWDLQISKSLCVLEIGNYYTNNIIVRLTEDFGFLPIFIAAFFGCMILFRKFYGLKSKLRYLYILFIVAGVGVSSVAALQIFDHYFEAKNMSHLLMGFDMIIIYGVFGVLCGVLGVYFFLKISDKTNDKLMNLVYIIGIVGICYLSVEIIKIPFGRIRYRAMNEINDFAIYAPWYHLGNATGYTAENFSGGKDAFKSFPSGHTFNASAIWILTCLPYIFERLNTKKSKIIIYSVCIAFVGCVMIGRIMAGAHFLTDVTFTAGYCYLAVRLGRHFFLIRNKSKLESKIEA